MLCEEQSKTVCVCVPKKQKIRLPEWWKRYNIVLSFRSVFVHLNYFFFCIFRFTIIYIK